MAAVLRLVLMHLLEPASRPISRPFRMTAGIIAEMWAPRGPFSPAGGSYGTGAIGSVILVGL